MSLVNCVFTILGERFKRQSHKMVKHTQTVRREQPTKCLSVFDHFVNLALKRLTFGLFELHSHVPNCRGVIFNFRKILPPVSLYYDPSLIKNFDKATNPPPLIKPIPFCAYDLTGRYSSVFFKLTPFPLIPVEYK